MANLLIGAVRGWLILDLLGGAGDDDLSIKTNELPDALEAILRIDGKEADG